MFKNDKPSVSFGKILLFFVLFFPISFIMILVRIIKHRNLSFQKIRDMQIIAFILLIIYGMIACIFFVNKARHVEMVTSGFYISCFVLLLPGVLKLIWCAQRGLSLNKRYTYLRHLTISQGETAIGVLSQLTKKRAAIVENDLLRMIYLGLLPDGFIDEISNRIVFYNQPHSHHGNNVNVTVNVSTNDDDDEEEPRSIKVKRIKKPAQLAPKTVECSGCGSKDVLQPGETKSCIYCNASLVYP